ncbi:MAG: aminopeptidase, partial [Verrucomicrobia bacterium]|nr:aminopeptidase [Verrucomicrobiota bacterium]
MKNWLKKHRRIRFTLLCLALAAGLSGCATTQYYWQALSGQVALLSRQERIERVLERTDISPALREKLLETLDLRQFAEKELRLPVDGQYRNYADVRRRFVVWNVHAAPAFSLEARTWWYPWVGRLKYRGYFREDAARRLAAEIAARGDDVYVGGVEAYSTLGWFRDPILNTFIHHDSADLAEILFHELAHQQLFISGDTDFNEAFAVSVAQEGTRRWLRARKTAADIDRYDEDLRKERAFIHVVLNARAQLNALYRSGAGSEPARLRSRKEALIEEMRQAHEALRTGWGGVSPYDAWFSKPVNNARLNTVATYQDLVPGFEKLLAACGGDLPKFYAAVKQLGIR